MNIPPISYLRWAKERPKPSVNLTSSGMSGVTIAELGIPWEELSLAGDHGDGFPPLIEALASRYGVKTGEVVTVPGTSMALFMVCAALLEPGDEAVVEKPAYEPLAAVPALLSAVVRRFERRYDSGYRLDVEALLKRLGPKTRLILLTNLHNPSGILTGRDDLRALAEAAGKRGVWLIVDEVYLEFLPPGKDRTAFGLAPNVVALSSLTKVYGLGGLRRGWILAPVSLARKLNALRDYLFNEEVLLEEQISSRLLLRLEEFRKRTAPLVKGNTARMREFMAGEDRLSWVEPDGGVVCFPRLREGSGRRLEEILRRSFDTGIVPGDFFGEPEHVRIGFGVDREILDRGLENIRRALDYL